MAKLIIYRGDALDREIDLPERTCKIGRGDQNDIVLTDPGKSVSRFHAELRFEQGRFTVADLNSQNGTWVAGRRVQQAVLEAGVPVVLGTYRIVLKKETPAPSPEETDATLVIAPPAARPASPAPSATPTAPVVTPSTAATMVGAAVPSESRTPAAAAPAPSVVSRPPAPVKAEPPKPTPAPVPAPRVDPPAPAVAPKPESPPSPPAPRQAPPAAPPPSAPAPAPPAVPLAAAVAPGPQKPAPPPPVAPKSEPAKASAVPAAAAPRPALAPAPAAPAAAAASTVAKPAAKRGISRGLLAAGFVVLVLAVMAAAVFLTPLKQQLPLFGGTPSQAVSPAPEAARPAAPAEPPAMEPAKPVETPAAAPTPPVAPAQAAGAPGASGPPPTTAPPRPSTSADAAAKPAAPAKTPPSAPPPAAPRRAAAPAATPAASGQRRGGEKPVAPAVRPINVAQTIDEGRSAMIKGDYLAAIAAFEAAVKADPKNVPAADLLGVARGGAKNASQLAVDSGNKAEMGGDYTAAARQYERALQLDPESAAAPDAIRRMKARMQGEGEDAFKRARQYDALGRAKDAIPMYEKAIELLPSDHASVAVAKERLAALKGGL